MRAIALGTIAIVAASAIAAVALLAPRTPQPAKVPAVSPPPKQTTFNPLRGSAPLTEAEERSIRAGDFFWECGGCPAMVVVPAGSFTMGSRESEPERFSTEGPQRKVTFVQPLIVGRFATSFEEWGACANDGGCNGDLPSDHGWGRRTQPVINVSWNDGQAYVAWLSRKTGKTYRLLSEAEREYVTRAGTTTPFWWGETISPAQANYNGTLPYNNGPRGEYRQRTVPVGSFASNPWGLYQVHGNVWEWTADCWNDSYRGAPTDGSPWLSGDCTRRMVRGGSWEFNPGLLRAAARFRYISSSQSYQVGFRVARTFDR
jgi:formylglycine-generating enzyme required for sulfatase activity